MLTLFALALLSACSARAAPECQRRSLPAFPLGVNLVDLPEDWKPAPQQGQRGYGSDAARAQLDRVKALGLDLVALPVTLWAETPRASSVGTGPLLSARGRARLARVIDDAHARGLAVMLVPHLQFKDGGWRGDLDLKTAPALLADYHRALTPVMKLAEARCVEVYSVGVELKSVTTSPAGDRAFAALVDGARALFKGTLVYSANWDELERVRAPGAVDVLGVNAFFPLSADPAATDDALAAGARAAHERIAQVARASGKPVWITELGFRATPSSWVQPWLWPREVAGAPADPRAQLRAYRAHARAVREVPAARALLFWLIPSDPRDLENEARYEGPSGFSFLGKPAEAVVRDLVQHRPRR